ncbi:MAG: PAS domain-containing protein [Rhodospirillales bacterium]|nr:PAS domain-containing protein [Rhodospirillales bacterium]
MFIADPEAAFEDVLVALAQSRSGVLEKYTRFAAPTVCWSPAVEAVPIPALRNGLARWHALRGDRQIPDWHDFRSEEFGMIVSRSSVVDPIPGTTDLRYRIFGSRIAESVGRDWEGATIGDIARAEHRLGPVMIRAVYILAHERKVPVYTRHSRARGRYVDEWHRIVLPFRTPESSGIRFLAAAEVVERDANVGHQAIHN